VILDIVSYIHRFNLDSREREGQSRQQKRIRGEAVKRGGRRKEGRGENRLGL
jgi:hypothetical protein